jgi:hypothetical protein
MPDRFGRRVYTLAEERRLRSVLERSGITGPQADRALMDLRVGRPPLVNRFTQVELERV